MIIIICCECNKIYGAKIYDESETKYSHGYCGHCHELKMKEINDLKENRNDS